MMKTFLVSTAERGRHMLAAIVVLITTILLLLFFIERRTMLFGGVFLCWAITTIVFVIVTLETYEEHLAVIVAFIIFVPLVILFPFYFTSFVILLITSDRKSTRLNSSHVSISYAVFFLTQ